MIGRNNSLPKDNNLLCRYDRLENRRKQLLFFSEENSLWPITGDIRYPQVHCDAPLTCSKHPGDPDDIALLWTVQTEEHKQDDTAGAAATSFIPWDSAPKKTRKPDPREIEQTWGPEDPQDGGEFG
ncbi:hypothetical protein ElyMa_005999800 [Elysia marginata]|uniref:Uncharacterized protein n=1 Tax=Elysia marginata TaxID=1093978 RepID=A0AAV4GFY4_9GAST|nr:hypothetical protein ElyMa_005999800 [Elysia marginata]